jgi:hypothetical protein
MSEIIFLSNVRLSFPQLVEPRSSVENGPKKYSADFIMPMNHPGVQAFSAEYTKGAQEKWKEHAQAVMQLIQNDRKLRCYGQGNEKVNSKTFKHYDGYADQFYISSNKDQMPQMIQADGSAVDATNTMAYQALARKLYGGCYVNAAIRPWLQENKHGRGIRADLVAVQFAGDDQAFGEGRTDASNMFGAVAAAPAGMFGAAAPAPAFLQPAAPQQMPLPPFMTGQ